MPTIFSKGLINNIYKKMNSVSKIRCKSRFPDSEDNTNYKICQSQSMADNARIIIGKLRAQKTTCNRMPDPDNCMKTIDEIIQYLELKQKEYEDDIDRIKDLEG